MTPREPQCHSAAATATLERSGGTVAHAWQEGGARAASPSLQGLTPPARRPARRGRRVRVPRAFKRPAKTFGGWWWWQQLRITSGWLPLIGGSIYREDDHAYLGPQPNCAVSWVLVNFRIRSRMFGQVRVFIVRVMHNSPADRSPARVQRWPSAGTRRGQYAGSALLRNEAVHSVLPGPRAVSCLVFCSRKARDG